MKKYKEEQERLERELITNERPVNNHKLIDRNNIDNFIIEENEGITTTTTSQNNNQHFIQSNVNSKSNDNTRLARKVRYIVDGK
jgi:hypothetical protein